MPSACGVTHGSKSVGVRGRRYFPRTGLDWMIGQARPARSDGKVCTLITSLFWASSSAQSAQGFHGGGCRRRLRPLPRARLPQPAAQLVMFTTWDGSGCQAHPGPGPGSWPATLKHESPELGVASKPPLRDNCPMSTDHTSALPPGVDGVEIKVTLGAEMVERGRQAFRIGLAQAERRSIWFAERLVRQGDPVALPLLSRGVIIRIRQREGEDDDATLKLRGPEGCIDPDLWRGRTGSFGKRAKLEGDWVAAPSAGGVAGRQDRGRSDRGGRRRGTAAGQAAVVRGAAGAGRGVAAPAGGGPAPWPGAGREVEAGHGGAGRYRGRVVGGGRPAALPGAVGAGRGRPARPPAALGQAGQEPLPRGRPEAETKTRTVLEHFAAARAYRRGAGGCHLGAGASLARVLLGVCWGSAASSRHPLPKACVSLSTRSVRWRRGFPSDFPPPDAGPRGTGRNGRGRRVTAEAVGRPFVHVTSDDRDQVGMGRDPRGDGGATCKIAGIAYTGSNPVPATTTL